MAEATIPVEWQGLFTQHQSILQTHLKFLNSILSQYEHGTPGSEVLKTFLAQTETMTQAFLSSREAFIAIDPNSRSHGASLNGNDPPREPSKAEETLHTSTKPVTTDASGLFTIDSNPTPLDQLLARNTTSPAIRGKPQVRDKAKRKASNADTQLDMLGGDSIPGEPAAKRVRIDVARQNVGEPPDIHASSLDDSFVREVEARHNAKEERRKKRSERKRKRESGSSLSETVNSEGQSGGPDKTHTGPKSYNKKRKKSKSRDDRDKGNHTSPFRGKFSNKKRKADINGSNPNGIPINGSSRRRK